MMGGTLKRTLDLGVASTGLVLLSPLIVMLALAIRFGPQPGPILFGHTRIGRGGREFRCYKFRTMAVDGDRILCAHLAACPSARKEWAETFKLHDDPRVTDVGRVLRKLSLDELPQLINVIAGDMSLVGPRPVVREELTRYGRSVGHYLRSRPGLTGLWQISGRSDTSYRKRVAYDRYYVENWSVATDIVILLRTIPAVCFGRGSY